MNAYLIPGLLGLLTGLLLHWGKFSRAEGLRCALGLRRSLELRTALTALGWGVMLTALLMWLAVIDVDRVEVLPLTLGGLLGGAVFGICAGLCGFTPTTAFAGLPRSLEALCVIAGCFAGALLSPVLSGLLAPLHRPWLDVTLFEVTLDEPFLFSGGFAGLGALGALLAVWGLCIPSPQPVIVPDEAIAERAAATEEPRVETQLSADQPNAEESSDLSDAPAETVVAILEGEEPLIVDTALDEASQSAEEAAPDESDKSDDPAESDEADDLEESDKPQD